MKTITKTLIFILLAVIIRSIYIHDELYSRIFLENYWVAFYIIGFLVILIVLMNLLEPLRKNSNNDEWDVDL
ncbi:hypothetical protein SAMN04487764_1946 [Gillisia sp. Hel1_33_143]|uniref:hypothetical protein n=1 Tax=Gillisia sp. Hel1_33_143 TaxID=1336796 RepID=UPI00087D9A51|nr:hypothetical protein [Gillisia sp. Hel1_33_143]SDS31785.1 hypothetical protein SAMN04487764_1946 [Gillisia sp. Hel1_33_143]